ncbi:prephenate dehydrogenase [Bogoriella caseilytica]|uniref:Prephenate dehydrogenase n=1 Tax=Bogoriella caseilytica TaxID=56055 RepID=A0A3N2BGH8_9MICO|nr:prephenate dehydrogenase [Bogoriella caseilytica]ROR74347.1 prephenate dehydrogenase [Bogoriella caseilytica]
MTAATHGPGAVGTRGPVKVIGAGLLGASLGLALRGAGVEVQLADASPQALALARDLGAGDIPDPADTAAPSIVVVATPPDVAAVAVIEALRAHPGAVVTDVASVKAPIEEEVLATSRPAELDVSRYVGSHPMAGRERSGAAAAHADLFAGRPWVIVPHAGSAEDAVLAVRTLAADVGSAPVRMGASEHDDAVALVSHLPQLAATLVATRLVDAPEEALALAGQGLRDVTRIAASDPQLWSTILVGNAAPVAAVLRQLREDLDQLLEPLDRSAEHGPDAPGATGPLAQAVAAGNRGVERIPGKHGGAPRRYSEVTALVPDEPGALARLLAEVGEEGVNLEDLHLEHSAGQRVGLARISVLPAAAGPLEKALERRGWQVVAP